MKEKSIRLSELRQIFSITEETVRRGLEKLEKRKKLIRSQDGPVSINTSSVSAFL
ncbi:hypothetical protein GCM10011346_07730 [Oceanobacillus neutriphilus]|uniref:HTH deoR-type domain-containing protein n=1 Tax=Oceanobacillus neutriphilus TaxID=531815 RepID=A0ABQ2NTK5_9BACI|nr:hypothetical protein GCM10011346_07730 [Oceanobacillus neutriphilus]